MFTNGMPQEWVNILAQGQAEKLYDCQHCYREYLASELFPVGEEQWCQECIEFPAFK